MPPATPDTNNDRSSAQYSVLERRYRVLVTESHPRELPLQSKWILLPPEDSEEIRDHELWPLVQEVRGLMAIHNMYNSDAEGSVYDSPCIWLAPPPVDVVSRFVEGQESSGRQTILVHADWDDEKSAVDWRIFAESVKKYADNWVRDNLLDYRFDVEVMATQITTPMWAWAVRNRCPDLEPRWEEISLHVRDMIDDNPATRDRWRVIHLCYLEKRGAPNCYDSRTYIYVEVEDNYVHPSWELVIVKIEEWISQRGLDVGLQFSHKPRKDFMSLYATMISYEKQAALGHSLGVVTAPLESSHALDASTTEKDMGPLAGTLGCFVSVKVLHEGQVHQKALALTNWHVVRPGFKGCKLRPVESSRREGSSEPSLAVSARDAVLSENSGCKHDPDTALSPKIRAESPARGVHEATIARHARLVSLMPPQCVDVQDALRAKQEVFQRGGTELGAVFAGSGFRQDQRSDWALVEIDEKRRGPGLNSLPNEEAWRAIEGNQLLLPRTTQLKQRTWSPLNREEADVRVSKLKKFREEDLLVYKVGSASGPTFGLVDRYSPLVNHGPGKAARHELSIESFDLARAGGGIKPFSKPGDSGAVVWDQDGNVIGLLFRGAPSSGQVQGNYNLFTPIEVVMEDIRDVLEDSRMEVLGIEIVGEPRDSPKL